MDFNSLFRSARNEVLQKIIDVLKSLQSVPLVKEWLNQKETEKFLHVKKDTLRKLRDEGKIANTVMKGINNQLV